MKEAEEPYSFCRELRTTLQGAARHIEPGGERGRGDVCIHSNWLPRFSLRLPVGSLRLGGQPQEFQHTRPSKPFHVLLDAFGSR